jgi:sugar lactone lactonase YvrE
MSSTVVRLGWSSLIVLSACAADPAKRNPVAAQGAAVTTAAETEVVIELDAPAGNVTVDGASRVFFTFHPEAKPDVKLAEVIDRKTFKPFPDEGWQRPRHDQPYFISPLAVRVDSRGRLWVLDHADLGRSAPSLTAFDVETRQVVHRIEFPSGVAGWGSMLNDFWVDADEGFVFIADTSPLAFTPALIVYDIERKRARRVLQNHTSVKSEPHHMQVQGVFIRVAGVPLALAVDSIALSPDAQTLFFGPLTGAKMFRIDTPSLRDFALPAATIASRVTVAGDKPSTDGIAADQRGRVYLSAIEHDGIWRLKPDGVIEILVQDAELFAWPDGLHLGPDERWLYVSVSELHRSLGRSLDDLPNHRPYRIVRVPLQ